MPALKQVIVVFVVLIFVVLIPTAAFVRMVSLRRQAALVFGQYLRKWDDHKIVLSCTTSPARIMYLHNVFAHLDLSMVYKVVIALPRRYQNSADDSIALFTGIPEWISSSSLFEIVWLDRDPGPVAKLLPALRLYPDATIITVDDDIRYNVSLVRDLVNAQCLYSKDNAPIVCVAGQNVSWWKMDPKLWPSKPNLEFIPKDMKQVQVAEGFGGVAYPAWRLNATKLAQLCETNKDTRMSDDLVISYLAAEQNIGVIRRKMPPGYGDYIVLFTYGLQHDALHKQNDLAARYRRALKALSSP